MPVNAVTKEVREARRVNNYFDWARSLPKLPTRKVYGVSISDNHGQTWRAKALCGSCISEVEPPMRLKRSIEAGTKRCDHCNCLNEMWSK